jgi:hypothetical protein
MKVPMCEWMTDRERTLFSHRLRRDSTVPAAYILPRKFVVSLEMARVLFIASFGSSAILVNMVVMVYFTRDSFSCGGPPRYQNLRDEVDIRSQTEAIDKRRHDGFSGPSSVI